MGPIPACFTLRVGPIGREQTISRRHHAVLDEQPAHGLDRPRLGQGVERSMVEREAAVADLPEQRLIVGEADPLLPSFSFNWQGRELVRRE